MSMKNEHAMNAARSVVSRVLGGVIPEDFGTRETDDTVFVTASLGDGDAILGWRALDVELGRQENGMRSITMRAAGKIECEFDADTVSTVQMLREL